MNSLSKLKIAIVHDWLFEYAGAERVLEQLLELFPHAELFAVCEALPVSSRHFLKGRVVQTTFIQKLPAVRKLYRYYLPLMPLAIEQLDLKKFDVILSSSHCVAKGVLTGPHQVHICLCYSPMRYAWDLSHQYLGGGKFGTVRQAIARYLLHRLRIWDYRTANGVDEFIAISKYIARRIQKVYGRTSTVVYPPVDTKTFTLQSQKEDYYFTASRLVPYKRVDLIVEAFANMPQRKLIVVGNGPEMKKIASMVTPNVNLLGYQEPSKVCELLRSAKAFVFAAEEDFGIAPLEAQACGTPVIAYGRGGALETIISNETGIFFDSQTADSIRETVTRFERQQKQFQPSLIRANAERYSIQRFRTEIYNAITRAVEKHRFAGCQDSCPPREEWLDHLLTERMHQTLPELVEYDTVPPI